MKWIERTRTSTPFLAHEPEVNACANSDHSAINAVPRPRPAFAPMPVLRNPRPEKFSQLVASGIKPTEAYTSLGYSKAGAPQSANNLLKRTDVRQRVNEIQSLAPQSSAEEVAFDQKRVLNRLDVLSRKAEELGQISAAARCEELIGKHLGMFTDRT